MGAIYSHGPTRKNIFLVMRFTIVLLISLAEVLDIAFNDHPFTFEIVKQIIVVKGREELKAISGGEKPNGTIEAHGVVMNEQGKPLSGANVTIKETGRGTTTNAKGEFTLMEVPVNSTLLINYIGYTRQVVKLKDSTNMMIFMKVAKNDLDKVVIQTYGTTPQRLNTGNITTVTAAEIERQPMMNPLEALEGRGRSVIDRRQSSEPLYIIDGVPLTVSNLPGDTYISSSSRFAQAIDSPAAGQSPFFSINPQDIESITILKGADATSIYGSRGANGVILITTKAGNAGKTKPDINVYKGESAEMRLHLKAGSRQFSFLSLISTMRNF